ncbi:MAG: hypothetical protein JWO80_2366, partial [Bryobacterales bacterium]|nr:hypothetical protein [Bryobacterales bacterium]
NLAIRVKDMPLPGDPILCWELGTHENTLLHLWFVT